MDCKGLLLLIILLANTLLFGVELSLQPSFYPSEAERKGAKPSQYGFVFGIVSLAGFISSPFFATYGARIGPKSLCITGGIVQGLSNVLFGALEFVDDTGWFIYMSYALRLIEGIAQVASNSAILAVVATLYPDNATLITALTRTTLGLGYMIGPIVGSFLYSLGGFGLPFYVAGIANVLLAFQLICWLPKQNTLQHDNDNNNVNDGKQGSVTMLDIGKSPFFVVPLANTFLAFAGCGMIESMLEPHLKNSAAQATQMQVALAFTASGLAYMVANTAAGQISDKINDPTIISIVGNIFNTLAFLGFGPATYLQMKPSVSLTIFATACNGLATGLAFVSSYARMNKAVERFGYKKDMNTNMVISSVWIGSFYLGNFVGPTASGFIIEAIGFCHLTECFQISFAIIMVIDIFVLVYSMKISGFSQRDKYECVLGREN